MGCISSKHVAKSSISPLHDSSLTFTDDAKASRRSLNSSTFRNRNYNHDHNYGLSANIKEETEDDDKIIIDSKRSNLVVDDGGLESVNNNKHSKRPAFTFNIRFGRSTVAEHVAAGWPAWLIAVAGEAIDGWTPLKWENFERFEKIGRGTYSSVYRARDLRTGRMMALKKVRFDNSNPESVSFMAREITILRKLDHPNIVKLEGIITSRVSSSIYLVFEYMEHDLAGLLSSPNIRFSESQIKCYMRQLLKGLAHCHSRGVLHRDIKTSNILVNNEGQVKIADFGLANLLASKSRQPLTNRVVTMWYRPPELLLGSTDYGTYVDMWSVGCVFAELFKGRPILKGRTEVEQLHKIFMLCGTPPDEYWTDPALPLATMFKPQHAYDSSLKEKFEELPKSAVSLIQTLLSIEPDKRGTAASALESEYFKTKPYACDPASLPKYPPSKEMDAKFQEEHRKKAGVRLRVSGASRSLRRGQKTMQEQTTFYKVSTESQARRNAYFYGANGSVDTKASYDTVSDVSQATEASQADTVCTLPAQTTTSSGWSTKRRKHVSFVTPTSQDVHSIEPRQAPLMPESENFRSRAQSGLRRANYAYESQDLSSQQHHEEERVEYSEWHRTNVRQEGYSRNGVPRSRFSRDAE
ncbi:probable serine/threonine-protein kinase At1g54610 isoform X1 [Cynara cardunculus var. scolymus]|uniref:probable serine/threonine-protein kinase At1g54610 isoform X1 n=1 Tax=Cynara cardunculus var. scolymus TaxID=59895 RepID=UPI000D62940C|nr:probable serine/threonine-protein kinase At1g54610 isoform X1 [Cynara cardunculus var. scolymus]